jgi:hypothetical protein
MVGATCVEDPGIGEVYGLGSHYIYRFLFSQQMCAVLRRIVVVLQLPLLSCACFVGAGLLLVVYCFQIGMGFPALFGRMVILVAGIIVGNSDLPLTRLRY